MGKKRRVDQWSDINDSLSEEIDDILEGSIRPVLDTKKLKVETRPWLEKYAPQQSSDVCMNPRKIKEIRSALEDILSGELECRLLVLCGPSGSSKSTVVKCLAKELLRNRSHSADVIEYTEGFVENGPLPLQFPDFLASCRYLAGPNVAVILIEELPNVFHEDTLNQFRNALKEWALSPAHFRLPPVVLCLTELETVSDLKGPRLYNIDNNLNVETLFGKDLIKSMRIYNRLKTITVQPPAKTFMTKTINKICLAERLTRSQNENKQFFTNLYESGDVRSLINNLEFWAKSKDKRLVASSFRESQISLFHAVGKIMYATSDVNSKDDSFSLNYHSIQSVLEYFLDLELVNLGILENYHVYNNLNWDIDIASTITEGLSLYDTFAKAPEFKEYGMLNTRNELGKIALELVRAAPMRFPRQFQLQKQRNTTSAIIQDYRRYIKLMRVLKEDVNLLDGCLVPQILNSFKYKLKRDITKEKYERIGGRFIKLFAETTPTVMEHEDETENTHEDQFRKDIKEAARKEEELTAVGSDTELSDAIDDSSEQEELDDTLDEQFLMMTQRDKPNTGSPRATINDATDDEMQDDPELDMLVSLGKL